MSLFQHGEPWMFDLAADVYGWMTWQEVWRDHCRMLVDHFPVGLPERPRILDLGIGPGVSAISILDRLPNAEVVGLDYSERMLTVARRFIAETGKSIELVRADAARTPFEDASFDVVTGHSFLYLVPDKKGVIDEIGRVLRPGGGAVFLEPHQGGRHADWMRLEGRKRFKLSMALWRTVSGGIGRFSPQSLRELLHRQLEEVSVQTSLNGLGLIGAGRKPVRQVRGG